MPKNNKKLGYIAENLALLHLEGSGLKIIEKNFLCKFGEIDLIMQDKDTLVFVEVRSRKINKNFAHASESVDKNKIAKIIKASSIFLNKNTKFINYSMRFDVVAIDYAKNIENSDLEWIKSAFIC